MPSAFLVTVLFPDRLKMDGLLSRIKTASDPLVVACPTSYSLGRPVVDNQSALSTKLSVLATELTRISGNQHPDSSIFKAAAPATSGEGDVRVFPVVLLFENQDSAKSWLIDVHGLDKYPEIGIVGCRMIGD